METFQDILDLSNKTGLPVKRLFDIYECDMVTITEKNLVIFLNSTHPDFRVLKSLWGLIERATFSPQDLEDIRYHFERTSLTAYQDALKTKQEDLYLSYDLNEISDFSLLEEMRWAIGRKKPEVVDRIIFLINNFDTNSIKDINDMQKAENIGNLNCFGYDRIKKVKLKSNFTEKLQERGHFLCSQFDIEKMNSHEELHRIIFDNEYCSSKQKKRLNDRYKTISKQIISKIKELSDINTSIYYDIVRYDDDSKLRKKLVSLWKKLINSSEMTKEEAVIYLEEVPSEETMLQKVIIKKIAALS